MELSVRRLTGALGALVQRRDGQPLAVDGAIDPSVADAMHAALMEHQVLFLPDAVPGPGELAALARSFGPIEAAHHSYPTLPDHPDVVELCWDGDRPPDAAEWHADFTFRPTLPFLTALRAVDLPPLGGDTLWASMYSVHDALSPGLRSELVELEAVHDLGAFRCSAYQAGGIEGLHDAVARAGAAVHPVILHHPFTGRPYLNVSESFTRWIVGYSAPESARLLTHLFDLINRPDHHVRLRWEPDMVALWDNRATQHYAVADYLPHRRVMQRIVVSDDARAPGGPTGPVSVAAAVNGTSAN